MYWGDIQLGETHDVTFETTVNGVPTTLAGSPAVAAYVDNGLVELTAGLTLTVDLDTRTGLHQVRIVATAGNGYASGTSVSIVLTAGTVGGDSVVGRIVGWLTIERGPAFARIGAAGAGLTAVPWNAAWDPEVQSEVEDALDVILADSVPADGTLPTVRQALYMLTQFMLERAVSGTTVTVKKADGSTTLFTLTINDATTPTSITRAT